MATAGSVFVDVLPDMSKFAPAVAGEMAAVNRKLKKSTVALGAVATGATAAGAALFAIGSDFDAASDKIRIGTGKTGKALAGLNDDFKAVIKGVPATFENASDAVSQLNQRLGLTGKPLQRLSKQMLELSRITGTDLDQNIREVTRTFGDWGIAMKDQPDALNKMFRASQKTGTSVQDLGRQLVRYGAPLRQLGFSFEEAAGLVAKFEQAGVNAQLVLGSMRIALSKLAQQGVKDPARALDTLTDKIRDAGTAGEANAIALETFGARAGPDMAAAIREGKFDLGNLFATIDHGKDTVQKASKSTQDFSETWLKFKNNVMVALEPLAKRVFGGISKEAAALTKILTDPKLSGDEKFSAILDRIGDGISNAIPKIADAVAKAAPKVAKAFVEGFLNASVWGKLAIAGLLVSKFGGVGAWKAIGRKLGAPLGIGMAETAAAGVVGGGAAGGGLGGRLGKLSPRMRAVGKGVLGAALAVGFGAAMTDSRDGLGNRIQNALSGLTLGLIPATKTIAERLSKSVKGALQGALSGPSLGTLHGPGVADAFFKSLEHDLPATEKRIVRRLVDLRRQAINLFGKDAKLKLDVAVNPGRAKRDLDSIRTAFVRLKGGAITSVKDLRKTVGGAFEAIDRTMGVHSKAGRVAAERNFGAARSSIQQMVQKGQLSARQGMREIARLLTSYSHQGKSGVFKNFKELAPFIGRTMTKSGGLTQRGMDAIRLIMVNSLQDLGLSKNDIRMSLNKKASARKGFTQPGARGGLVPDIASGVRNYQAGGLVQFGQRGGAGPDNIPVQFGNNKIVVGSGEVGAVFNRHQLPVLNARLSDMGGLPGFFQKFDRKHSSARGGVVAGIKRFATGGFVDDDFSIAATGERAQSNEANRASRARAKRRARRRNRRIAALERKIRKEKWKIGMGDPDRGPSDAGFGGLIEQFAKGGIVGMMAAANKLEKAHFPYVWGGGHSGTPAPFGPMDCSGAVSFVLQHGGVQIPTMVSGALASAGQTGPGNVTVFANPTHTFMRIGSRYFGTSGTNPGGGAGWFPDPGAGYRSRFAQRHFNAGPAVGDIPRFVVEGDPSLQRTAVQQALDVGRRGANQKLADLMSSTIGAGDVGDPGPGGFSKSKLKQLWIKAGGAPGSANLAAAVALAESGGRPDASNTNSNGSIDRGLWQINSVHGKLSTFDPEANARAAVSISSGGSNWHPWVTYNKGTYRQFLAKGGLVGYVGDSLGVGTAPKLKGRIGDLVARVKNSRTSAQGLNVLKGMLGPKYGRYIWDLGTNDPDAGAVKSALKAADRMTKDKLLLAATVTGANSKSKNAAFHALSGGDVNLFDWAKRSKGLLSGDVHPDAAGYSKRAAMMAGALKAATSRHKGKGKDGGEPRLPKLKGSLSHKARQTASALSKTKNKKRRSKILKRFAKLLASPKFGLPKKLFGEINFLAEAHARFAEYADNAESLDVESDDGITTRGVFKGKNVGGWLTADLGAMFSERNKLVKAFGIVTRNKGRVDKTFGFVSELLKNLSKDGKTPRHWKGLNPAKDSVEKWNKQAQPKRVRRMKEWHTKHGKLPGTREFNAHNGRIKEAPKSRIPSLKKVKGALKTQSGVLQAAISPTSDEPYAILPKLDELQGLGGPMAILKSPWPIGTLGGDIFDTQKRMLELFKVPPKTTDDTTADKADDTRVPLLEQLLREANLRTAVSERQFDVLRNFPPFGGQFATGGVVPGPAGAPRTVIAHGGETITPVGAGAAAPNVYVSIDGKVAWLRDFVDTRVEQQTRQQARRGGRVLPGRAGGN